MEILKNVRINWHVNGLTVNLLTYVEHKYMYIKSDQLSSFYFLSQPDIDDIPSRAKQLCVAFIVPVIILLYLLTTMLKLDFIFPPSLTIKWSLYILFNYDNN